MGLRNLINNKIRNGSVTYVPTFVAPMSVGGKWMDGTSTGSITDTGSHWFAVIGVGNVQFSMLPGILKIEATNATGHGRFLSGSNIESATTIQNLQQNAIPVLPSTSYTFSYKVKTTNALANSVRAEVLPFKGDGTTAALQAPAYTPAGDSNGFVSYSVTFVTGATTTFVGIRPGIFTAGQVQTAEFSELKLDTTVPFIRTVATNRRVVRDGKTALQLGSTASYISAPTKSGLSAGFTLAGNFQVNPGSSTRTIVNHVTSGSDRIGITVSSAGDLRCGYYNGTIYVGIASSNLRVDDRLLYNFVYSFNGTIGRLYLNGILQVGTNQPITQANTGFIIGADTTTVAAFLGGLIERFRLWNRPLSSLEATNMYYQNIVPKNSLVAEYLFDEASGTTALDTSGNGNHGTITGATYVPSPNQPRVVARAMGTALKFNGVNNQVTSLYNVPNTASYTFSGWAYRNNNSAAHTIVGTNDGTVGFRLNIGSGSNDMRFQANLSSGGAGGVVFTNAAKLNDKFFWTVTYDRVTAKLYINGKLFGSQAYTEDFATGTKAFVVGKYGTGGAEFFNGVIDEIRVHDRILTAQEVSDMYFQDIIPRNGLKVEYLFDEGSGTITNDTSGNGYTGTITGATFTTFTPLKQRTIA